MTAKSFDDIMSNTAGLAEADVKALLEEMRALQTQVQQQAQQIQTLERDTLTDPLTAVLNRRGFDMELNRSMANARRHGRHGALLLLDMNNFKAINDSFGHHVGDLALQHVAGLLSENVRDTDVVARIGGDEFAVILNDVRSPADAERRARELTSLIQATPVKDGAERIWIEGSIGCHFISRDEDMIEVLSQADAAMYAAKPKNQQN